MSKMLAVIDGDVVEITEVLNYGYLPIIRTREASYGIQKEYYIVKDREDAEEAVVRYWEDMINRDPRELRCLVGDETLIQWAMGHSAGPGYVKARNLTDWVEAISHYPEEQWASYDGQELDGMINRNLAEELDFHFEEGEQIEVILYRCN